MCHLLGRIAEQTMNSTIPSMPKKPKPPSVTVRVPKEIARQIRIAAAAADEDAPDYLARILAPILEKELKKLSKDIESKSKSAPD
jgi:hypothetical protein